MELLQAKTQDIRRRDWIVIGLLTALFLTISGNVALLIKYDLTYRQLCSLRHEKQQRAQKLARLGMKEISRWQAQIAAWPLLEQALYFFKLGNADATVACLDRAIDRYPYMPIANYLRALAHIGLGNDDKAVADLTAYLGHSPASVYGFWYRAQIYQQQNKLQRAVDDLENVLAHDPEFEMARKLLNKLLNKLLKKQIDKTPEEHGDKKL